MNATASSIFVSTACLGTSEPLLSRVSAFLEHGIQSIELGARVTTEGVSRIAFQLPPANYLVHNYFPPPLVPFVLNLASVSQEVRQRSLDLVSNALQLSAELNSSFYSVHAGFITDPTGFGSTSFLFPMPTSPLEEHRAMKRFITSLGYSLEKAQQSGVQLLVENNVCTPELRGKLLLQSAEEFLHLFNVLPSPNLGILVDTGHLNVTAHTLGFDRMAFVEQIAPFVKGFHIHDNDGTADLHQPVKPGSWVLEVLKRPEFAATPIIVESVFSTVEELHEHVGWLRKELGRE